jgi:hypothetical protein
MEQPRTSTITSASAQKQMTLDPVIAPRDHGIILELRTPEIIHPRHMVRQITSRRQYLPSNHSGLDSTREMFSNGVFLSLSPRRNLVFTFVTGSSWSVCHYQEWASLTCTSHMGFVHSTFHQYPILSANHLMIRLLHGKISS